MPPRTRASTVPLSAMADLKVKKNGGVGKIKRKKEENTTTMSYKAGIHFPVGRVKRYLKRLNRNHHIKGSTSSLMPFDRVSTGAAVYMAAVLEFCSADLLKIAGDNLRRCVARSEDDVNMDACTKRWASRSTNRDERWENIWPSQNCQNMAKWQESVEEAQEKKPKTTAKSTESTPATEVASTRSLRSRPITTFGVDDDKSESGAGIVPKERTRITPLHINDGLGLSRGMYQNVEIAAAKMVASKTVGELKKSKREWKSLNTYWPDNDFFAPYWRKILTENTKMCKVQVSGTRWLKPRKDYDEDEEPKSVKPKKKVATPRRGGLRSSK